nr:MAG TPA: hypothetical protein [Caudoviricetes sp.]DAO01438.1 MAG TPA: hypothetical protein [Caudoviricetes sp.]DAX31438.1 MAG TPA: hypothetical protein [Caudoviricetes sp.]
MPLFLLSSGLWVTEQLTGGLQTKVRSLALNKFHIIN